VKSMDLEEKYLKVVGYMKDILKMIKEIYLGD
jgi:hypothetical protein